MSLMSAERLNGACARPTCGAPAQVITSRPFYRDLSLPPIHRRGGALLDELWRGEHVARRMILVAQVAVAPLLAVNAKLASPPVDRSPPPFFEVYSELASSDDRLRVTLGLKLPPAKQLARVNAPLPAGQCTSLALSARRIL
jgi:hypothetical protein